MEAMDLTLQQAADLLDAYRKEHKLARIVDPDECRKLDIAQGSCQYGRPCHAVWGSNHRCSNCISYQACHTDKERRKQELRNRQLFEITSRPVNLHVDAQRRSSPRSNSSTGAKRRRPKSLTSQKRTTTTPIS